jgi:hypothetical protein
VCVCVSSSPAYIHTQASVQPQPLFNQSHIHKQRIVLALCLGRQLLNNVPWGCPQVELYKRSLEHSSTKVSQSVSHSLTHSLTHSVSRSVSQSVGQSVTDKEIDRASFLTATTHDRPVPGFNPNTPPPPPTTSTPLRHGTEHQHPGPLRFPLQARVHRAGHRPLPPHLHLHGDFRTQSSRLLPSAILQPSQVRDSPLSTYMFWAVDRMYVHMCISDKM